MVETKQVLKKYCIKSFRKLRYRKGFGVHSPFAYDLITTVIEERCRYYSYNAIELFLKKTLYPRMDHTKLLHQKKMERKKTRLLFRLVNRFNPQTILEIGTSWGISSLYMNAPHSAARQLCIEPDAEIAQVAKEVIKQSNIQLLSAHFDALPTETIEKLNPIEFVLIHASRSELSVEKVLGQIAPSLSPEAVVVIDGIRKNSFRQQEWKQLESFPKVTVSMDLYDMGLLFFFPKLNRQHYIVSF